MDVFNLQVSEYGISLTSYFGDIYFFWRSILLVIAIVIILRGVKILRWRNAVRREERLLADPTIWEG
jgi:hypothetical protein